MVTYHRFLYSGFPLHVHTPQFPTTQHTHTDTLSQQLPPFFLFGSFLLLPFFTILPLRTGRHFTCTFSSRTCCALTFHLFTHPLSILPGRDFTTTTTSVTQQHDGLVSRRQHCARYLPPLPVAVLLPHSFLPHLARRFTHLTRTTRSVYQQRTTFRLPTATFHPRLLPSPMGRRDSCPFSYLLQFPFVPQHATPHGSFSPPPPSFLHTPQTFFFACFILFCPSPIHLPYCTFCPLYPLPSYPHTPCNFGWPLFLPTKCTQTWAFACLRSGREGKEQNIVGTSPLILVPTFYVY